MGRGSAAVAFEGGKGGEQAGAGSACKWFFSQKASN